MKKRIFSVIMCVLCTLVFVPMNVYAQEGVKGSYLGHIPENKTFAFVDSRYYDGTDYVKVFNVGFYMNIENQYYVNGDWTDLTKVYRREDYEAFSDFNNGITTVKHENYPTNDVGADGDGQLSSYNAGVYTTVSWTNLSGFGHITENNYEFSGVRSANNVTTYVEIWKVDPQMTLSVDKENITHGDTFTLTLNISNHFNNMEGLPASSEVVFKVDNATAISDVTKTDNVYTQTFQATEETSLNSINVKAGVADKATNYNEKYVKQTMDINPKMEILNEAPVITAEDKTLTVGDTFSPLDGVTATDTEDEDLTDKIEVTYNDVDTSTAGTYSVTYKVTDSQGASITKTITVTVEEKEDTDNPSDTDKTDNGTTNSGNTTNTSNDDKDSTASADSPKTGDTTNLGLYTSLLTMSGLLIAILAVLKKKKAFGHK